MKILGKVSLVSGATLLSRILGLIRDILFFSIFGTSVFGEAFLLAFTFPNLFRRMLGEGTLTSALIPSYTSVLQKAGQARAFGLLNQVFTRLFCFLSLLIFVVCFSCWAGLTTELIDDQKWILGAQYTGITFAYVLLICCSAILIGILNVHGRFIEGAISPVLLNCCMICALAVGFSPWLNNHHQSAQLLCFGVLSAGILQLLMPWLKLRTNLQWKLFFTFKKSDELTRLSKLFWVGALGAAVAQLNILVSRLLAFSLEEEGALAFLYLSARLVELPLGVFAISVSTVLFPLLSTQSALSDHIEFKKYLCSGLRLILVLTIPATVGLFVLAEPIVKLLFEWKEFTQDNVLHASSVLKIASWTIPLYASSLFLVKVHHAKKNMNIPLKAAIYSFLCNFLMSLLLMNAFGVYGLVWANLISVLLQVCILSKNCYSLELHDLWDKKMVSLGIIIPASIFMGFFTYYFFKLFDHESEKLFILFCVLSTILFSLIFYLIILILLNFPGLSKFSNFHSKITKFFT